MPSRYSISRSAKRPLSEDSRPPSKRATIGLPATGDSPGRDAVDATLAGMVFQLSMGIGSTPIPTPDQ
jgi:hypothetical protein